MRIKSLLKTALCGWLGCQFTAALPAAAEERTEGMLVAGTPWATEYLIKDSGRKGPTVMIVGGVHGNEPAGYRAAEQIRSWPISRGKMIVLPRANVPALLAGKRYSPGVKLALANLNRNFAPAAENESGRGPIAGAIWKLVCEQRPDWLLDLHEGFAFKQIDPRSVGSSIIVHPTRDARQVAPLMLNAVNETIVEDDKKFVLLGPPVNTSLSRAAGEHLGLNTMILETTKADQPLSYRSRQHRIMVHRFLNHLDMIDSSVTVDWVTDPSENFGKRRVALYDAEGSYGFGVPRVVKLLEGFDDLHVVRIGAEDIQGGALEQFDVVVFASGSASRQARALGEDGRKKVRDFVLRGGGYLGLSGGAYLACDGFSWGLKILNAKTASSHWKRGAGLVEVELNSAGQERFGEEHRRLHVTYVNGPIFQHGDSEDLPRFKTLGRYRSELAENGVPAGVMKDSPAIITARYGAGRVVCVSPQFEQHDELAPLLHAAAAWQENEDRREEQTQQTARR